MKEAFATLEKREFAYSSERDFIQLIVFSALAFSIPLFFPQPQLLTGLLVNSFLVFAALGMKGKGVLPVIMLPSIGALANGLLFGPFTFLLVFMAPFIWMGNFALVFGIKRFSGEKGFWRAGAVSAFLKAGMIFVPAYLLYAAGVLPEIMLIPMGAIQLATALGGVALVGMGKRIMGN